MRLLAIGTLTSFFAIASASSGCEGTTEGTQKIPQNGRGVEEGPNHGGLPELNCCQLLAAEGLDVITPQDEDYMDRVNVHWSWTARLEPTCFVLPENAEEVSVAVTTLVKANEHNTCKFAVRSGGHTLYAGAANIEDGVTVDLSKINGVTYHADNETVSIEPGSRWGKVYETLDAVGVHVAGGRAASVGTAGLILGGGNSLFSARTGFVCDSVVNAQVVLANGTIIYANSETNSDLLQALKGGSMNFGIVTRFDMTTFKGDGVWGGLVSYPNSTLEQQVDALIKFGDNIENDPYGSAIAIFLTASASNTTTVVNAYHYTKPVERPAAYNDFLAIPGNISDTMRITNMSEIVVELEQAEGFRDFWLTGTFKADAKVMNKALQLQHIMFDKLWAAGATGTFNVQTLFNPVPTVFAKLGLERGGNVLGLDRFDENLMMWQFYIAYNGEEQDDLFQGLAHDVADELKAFAEPLGANNEFVYLDYADISQNPLKSYGEENLAKLKAAAQKYDPEEVWQKLVPGGFKISNV